MQQRKKRERRERRRRKKEDHGAERPATETLRWVSPDPRDPQYFFFFFFFFRFFFFFVFGDLRNNLAGRMKPTAGSSRKDLARDQTPRGQPTFAADPPRSRPTSHRDPRLGLAGRGSGFFFFFFFLPV
jgi:hypothetical protein